MKGPCLGGSGPAAREKLHLRSQKQGQVCSDGEEAIKRARDLFATYFEQ
jgi:hypothetical protein